MGVGDMVGGRWTWYGGRWTWYGGRGHGMGVGDMVWG